MTYSELFTKQTFPMHILGNIEDKQTLREFLREYNLLQMNENLLTKYERAVLIINSHGGDSDIASGVIDLLELSKLPIDGLAIGECKSAAVRILQYCRNRYSTKRTRFLIHESGSYFEKADYVAFSNIKNRFEDNDFRNNRLLKDTFHRSKLKDNLEKQIQLTKDSTYLNPDQCLEFGLIDEIIK